MLKRAARGVLPKRIGTIFCVKSLCLIQMGRGKPRPYQIQSLITRWLRFNRRQPNLAKQIVLHGLQFALFDQFQDG